MDIGNIGHMHDRNTYSDSGVLEVKRGEARGDADAGTVGKDVTDSDDRTDPNDRSDTDARSELHA